MITPFYCHGIFSNSESMDWLAQELGKKEGFRRPTNETYDWRDQIVNSGIELAETILSTTQADSEVLLVGHSQGGLVCRVAAVALAGEHVGTAGPFTGRLVRWQCGRDVSAARRRLGVVTIATPNAGAMTFGQMSVAAELLGRTIMGAADLIAGASDLRDLTTPRLFQEFEKWRVEARCLSISGVCVNRYSRGYVRDLTELLPIKRVSVRFDVPNDLLVEDSSTNLRESLIRPEVELDEDYKHVRAYPSSISLHHTNVQQSEEVLNVISDNLGWLFRRDDLV